MVDLVKIRKKKAEKQRAAGSGQRAEEPTQATQQPSNPATEEPRDRGTEEPVPVAEEPRNRATAQPESKLDHFKATAGTRRQTLVAQETAETAHLELLTFVIAAEHYAVDIERIVEIITPRSLTRIPNADTSVVGIISLRGTIVTLVDVRRKLRHPAAGEPTADTRIVVIDYRNEMIGFIVDRVLRVVKAEAGEIEAHPVVHATELDESIRGVFRAGGALTILLDLDKLLDSSALAASTA
jgi:purine-binding chemotaxis protein CheW